MMNDEGLGAAMRESAQNDKVEQLERRVKDLERRLDALERTRNLMPGMLIP